jgi:hypothetical protein
METGEVVVTLPGREQQVARLEAIFGVSIQVRCNACHCWPVVHSKKCSFQGCQKVGLTLAAADQ